MKKGKLIIFTLLVLSLIKLSAVEEKKLNGNVPIGEYEKENTQGLGFTAGRVSGVGFAYRQYFDKSGIQFTFGLLSDADNVPKFPEESNTSVITKKGWDVDGSIGFMYLRTLRESEKSRFYYFLGASLNIDYTKKYIQNYQYDSSVGELVKYGSPVKDIKNNNSYYYGPGIGIDFKLSKYVSFIVELPVSISSDKKIETYIPQGAIIIKF